MAEVASRTPSNTDRVTAHSISSEFSAAIQQGEAVESAAVKALQACEKAGIKPTAGLFNRESSARRLPRQLGPRHPLLDFASLLT